MNERFIILAERKPSKSRPLKKIASLGSHVKFIQFPKMSVRGFEQTAVAANAALEFVTKPVTYPIIAAIKKVIYGWQYNGTRRYFEMHSSEIAICWNGMKGMRRAFMMGATDAGARCLYVEHAPLPGKITIDRAGLNFLNSVPRDADFYRKWAKDNVSNTPSVWQDVKQKITSRVARSGYQQTKTTEITEQDKFIFCPLQVPSDTQIRIFGGWVKSVENMLHVLEQTSKLLPEGWHLRLKEHPSSDVSFGTLIEQIVAKSGGRLRVDNSTDTFEQVERSVAVLTINSSVGLEAMFFERPIIVLGNAFYGIKNLVNLVGSSDELAILLSDPSNLNIDSELRTAFLNYLILEYYPNWSADQAGDWTLDAKSTLAKLK